MFKMFNSDIFNRSVGKFERNTVHKPVQASLSNPRKIVYDIVNSSKEVDFMLNALLAIISIWLFAHTDYFEIWKTVKLGNDQLTISLTALVILTYLILALANAIRWYYTHRRRD